MNWMQQNPGIASALIAAISAIIGGIVVAGARFVFDFYLSERLKRHWQSIETKRRCSSPIVHAADNLAGRIDNLNEFFPKGLATRWLKPIAEEEVKRIPFERYYYFSSVFALARLIAWIKILRREQVFLDFASTKETRQFNAYLSLIYAALSAPNFTSGRQEREPADHWIYFHYLSGIAEAVVKRDELAAYGVLRFKNFVSNIKKRIMEISDRGSKRSNVCSSICLRMRKICGGGDFKFYGSVWTVFWISLIQRRCKPLGFAIAQTRLVLNSKRWRLGALAN